MPGTELAFAGDVACLPTALLGWKTQTIHHRTAIFRQVNKDKSATHHDALEFPDGRTVLLTLLCEGQAATVLQLPARPMSAAEEDAQKRVTYVGWQFRLDLLRPPYEAAYFFHALERRAWGGERYRFRSPLRRVRGQISRRRRPCGSRQDQRNEIIANQAVQLLWLAA